MKFAAVMILAIALGFQIVYDVMTVNYVIHGEAAWRIIAGRPNG